MLTAGRRSLLTASAQSSIWTLSYGGNMVYHQSNNSVDPQNYTLVNPSSVVTQSKYSGILSGVLSGTPALTISGGGTTVLSGANTYSGGTAVNQGATLQLGRGGASATNAGSGGIAIASGANMVVNWSGASNTLSNAITGAGTLTLQGDGIATNTNGGYNLSNFSGFTGTIKLQSARILIAAAQGTCPIVCSAGSGIYATGAITVSNPLSLAGTNWVGDSVTNEALRLDSAVTWAGTVALTANANIGSFVGGGTISGIISGAFAVNFNNGSGVTLTLTGVNTYSGGSVCNSGTTSFKAGAFLSGITGPTLTVNSGATAELNGNTNLVWPLSPSTTVNVNNGGTLKVTGATTQDTCCYFSTINLANTGTAAAVATADSSMLRAGYNTNSVINSSGSVANTWSAQLKLVNGNGKTFTISNSNALTLSGVISDYVSLGGLAINKSGAGTLTLTAANTYTGQTNVTAGTVAVQGSATSSTHVVSSGASISAGTVTTANIGPLTFSALAASLIVNAISTTSANKLTCTTLTAASGFTINVSGAMNAGTYPILVSTSGTPTPTLGTNTTGRTVTFAWSGQTLNMVLV